MVLRFACKFLKPEAQDPISVIDNERVRETVRAYLYDCIDNNRLFDYKTRGGFRNSALSFYCEFADYECDDKIFAYMVDNFDKHMEKDNAILMHTTYMLNYLRLGKNEEYKRLCRQKMLEYLRKEAEEEKITP